MPDFGQIFYLKPTYRGRALLDQYMWGPSPYMRVFASG